MKYQFIIIIVGLFLTDIAYSQNIAVKSNLLYDVTRTINLGVEFGLSQKTTLDASANFNIAKKNIVGFASIEGASKVNKDIFFKGTYFQNYYTFILKSILTRISNRK